MKKTIARVNYHKSQGEPYESRAMDGLAMDHSGEMIVAIRQKIDEARRDPEDEVSRNYYRYERSENSQDDNCDDYATDRQRQNMEYDYYREHTAQTFRRDI